MVTKSNVLVLLEDGPEEPSQLAEWLQMDPTAILTLLDRMDIPRCGSCGRVFAPTAFGATRYCSRDCDRPGTNGRPSWNPVQRPVPQGVAGQPSEASVGQCRRSRRDGCDVEFEVIWNGVGPLPGAGGAAGLGSTLSGTHFSIGRRV